ncbi:MAG TPA: Crp/Fnr family transcriptional regulator [Candidatus Binataceae bacterium]|nr:Crp/Fnr family transcriptional regulator [Candidatus Binataceae bacterium]
MLWRTARRVVTVTTMVGSARALKVRSLKALAGVSWLKADQLEKLASALTVTRHEKRSTIFSDKSPVESAYILLSGVARITCDNRKGRRTTAIMLAPGLIPAFPTATIGITYNFRCEAVTSCQVGTIGLHAFMKICLGIGSAAFKQMAGGFLGRWDRVHLRCSNLVGCTLEERLALVLLDLIEDFGVPNADGGVRLSVPVRHDDLAELVGATRPRVTERLRKFTQKHLISQQDRHLVLDPERLRDFLVESRSEALSGELS